MGRKSVQINVEPAILKYARRFSGYSIEESAKKIKIGPEVLSDLEVNGGEMSLVQLERAANLYKRPLVYFLLREVPSDVVLPKDFRIIYESEDDHLSPKVLLAVRKARYIQSVIKDLNGANIFYSFDKLTLASDIDVAADRFRKLIDVSIQEQSRWYQPATALRKWKEAVESLNIFVLQQSLTDEDVSAFCLADQEPYIISLDSSEHENRRIFSLFHEIGHILLHRSGVCAIDNFSRNSSQYIKVEKFCNEFAASFLVPRDNFLKNEIVTKLISLPFSRWDLNDVKVLSLYYRVSQEVIYRRLVTVGALSETEYSSKRAELIKGFEEYKKKPKGKELKIPFYQRVISQNGRAFIGVISSNLSSNRITLADASDYLGISSKHVGDVISKF